MKSFESPGKPSAHTPKVLLKMFRPSKKYPSRDTVRLREELEKTDEKGKMLDWVGKVQRGLLPH